MSDDSKSRSPSPTLATARQKNGQVGAKRRLIPEGNKRNGNVPGQQVGTSKTNSDSEEPAFYVRSRKRKPQTEKKEEMVEIMQGRTGFMEQLTDAVSTVAKAKPVAQPSTTIDMWGQILVEKVKGMGAKTARHFMLKVDTMASEIFDDEMDD